MQAFTAELSTTASEELDSVDGKISEARQGLQAHQNRRQQLELARNKIQFELEENLLKKRSLLESSLIDLLKDENYNRFTMLEENGEAGREDDTFLEGMASKRDELSTDQQRIEAKIERIRGKIASYQESAANLKEELESLKSLRREEKFVLETLETQVTF